MTEPTREPEPVFEISVARVGEGFVTRVRVNGKVVGLLQEIVFEASALNPLPTARAKLVQVGDDLEFEQLLKTIPWLDLEVERMAVLK